LNSSINFAIILHSRGVFPLIPGQLKTMCAGQPQRLCQRESRRLSLENPLSNRSHFCSHVARRLLAVVAAFAALVLSPAVSRADFIGDAALNQRLKSVPAVAGTLFGGDASLLDLFSGGMGSGASIDDRNSTPARSPHQNDDQPPSPKALAGNATGGCGSSSGSASGGASASPVGIVNEIEAPVAETCSGRIAVYALLSLPAPLAARLLDPPRDVA
jgi:hypothetical protein